MKLYWILFPIEDLGQAVETAKRILTKEKLDRQLTGQSSASPFMNIREETERRVSFSARHELGDKIDKLTVAMSRLVAKDNLDKRPFKPQIYKSRGKNRYFNCEHFQNRPSGRNRGQYTDSRPRQHYRDIILKETLEGMEDKIVEEDTGIMIIIEAETGQEKGHLQETIVVTKIEIQVTVDLGQDPELIQIEIE